MTSQKRFYTDFLSSSSYAVRRLLFLALFLLFGAAVLCPEEGFAAFVERAPGVDNNWETTDGWIPGNPPGLPRSQPNPDDNVFLNNNHGTISSRLDLGDSDDPLNRIGRLVIQSNGWEITGKRELQANNLELAAGSSFIIDGATLTTSGDNPLISITVETNVVASTLTLVNRAILNTKDVSITQLGAKVEVSGGSELNARDITVGSVGTLSVLSFPGGESKLTGRNLTVNGKYADNAGSRVELTGEARFNGIADRRIEGTFISDGLTTEGNLALGGEAYVKQQDNGIAANSIGGDLDMSAGGKFLMQGNISVGNDLKMGDGTELAGRDLTVYKQYIDDPGSKVTLTGDATFNDAKDPTLLNTDINGSFNALGQVTIFSTGTINSQDFSSKGLATSGYLIIGNGAVAKYGGNDGSGVADVQWGLVMEGNSTLAGGNLNVGLANVFGGNNLDMAEGSTLSVDKIDVKGNVNLAYNGAVNNSIRGTNLSVGGSYTDAVGSVTSIVRASPGDPATGNVTIGGDATIRGSLKADGNAIFNGGSSIISGSLAASGQVVFADNSANTLGGTFTIGGLAAFGAGSTTSISGPYRSYGMDIGDGANVDAAGATSFSLANNASTSFGNLAMGKDSFLNIGANALEVNNLSIADGSAVGNALTAGALTVHGSYTDSGASTVALTGLAHFNNSQPSDIKSVFSANDMLITGTGTRVTVNPASTFSLTGDLAIGAGGNALNAGTRALDLRDVVLGANSSLTAGGLSASTYADSASSIVDLSGPAIFIGQANINATGSGGNPGFISNGLTANGNLTLGANAFVQSSGEVALQGGTVTMGPYSQIRTTGMGTDGNITLAAGTAVDITITPSSNNINPVSASLYASGEMFFNNNALTLHHSGGNPQNGTWILAYAENGVSGKLVLVGDTASLRGRLDYGDDNNSVYYHYAYTPMSAANLAYLAAVPNARRAAAGFADTFNNRRTPFMHTLDKAYPGNMAGLEADVARNLAGMTAEAAVNHAAQTQRAHIDIANAALGYALGHSAPLSVQGFVPNLQASLMQMGQQANPFQAQQRRGIMAARQRISPAGADGIPAQKQYSVLANWQPASQKARQFVARAPLNVPIAGMAAGSSGIPGVHVWGGYVGTAVHQQKKDGYSGYNANQNGFLVGGSVDLAPEVSVGVYGGWTFGQHSARGVKAEIDSNSVHLGGFVRYRGQDDWQGLNVTGDIAYSSTNNESTRTVPLQMGSQKMDASYGQRVIGGGLEVAYDYVPSGDEYTRVTPFVAGRYSRLSQDGYTEKGNLPLKVDGIENDQFATTMGVRAARDFVVADDSVVITPRASAAWLHNWGNDRLSARSNFVGSPVSFNTRSTAQDRDAAQLGAGLDLRFKQDAGWDFGIKAAYGVDLRSSSTGHNFFGGFEVNF